VIDLLRFCYPGPDREHLTTPFAVEVDGVRWGCATDGHTLVAVAGAPVDRDAGDLGSAIAGAVAGYLRPPESPVRVAVATLRAWAAAPQWRHRCKCGECGEEYAERTPGDRPGWLTVGAVRARMDRGGVARVLADVPDEEIAVEATAPDDAVLFVGAGWRAAIMPLAYREDARADAHTLAIGGAP